MVQLGHAVRVEESPIDLDAVRLFLREQALQHQITLRAISAKAAKYFSVTTRQLRGPSRTSQVVRARGVAMLLARNLTDKSLEVIGDYFGGRDHTTVLHACRKTESLRHTNPAIAKALDELWEQLAVSQPPP